MDDKVILASSRAYRLQQSELVVDGVPFDLKRYPYLVELFDSMGECPHIVIRKGAQMGFTVMAVLAVIDLAENLYSRGVLYLMPTRDDVYDFSRSRFTRLLRDNESLGKKVRGTDSMNLKKVGHCFVYFRGARARSQLKSIPVDLLVTDERDEMEARMVDLAEKRLDGSRFRHHITFSTPTIPDHGVDLEYKASDQRMWHIRCAHCGKYTCMEADFPRCLQRDAKGHVFRACIKCSRKLDVGLGEWVPAKPAIESRGYYISQLCSPTVSPKTILDEWEDPEVSTGNRLGEFKNSRLGLAHADLEDMITREMLMECVGEDPMVLSAQGPSAMGVDIGKKSHHYWIAHRIGEKNAKVTRVGVAADFEELHDLYQKFNVEVAVMDQMAETHAVQQFKDSHPGVYGCYYSEAQRTDYHWDYVEMKVTVNRTQALDAGHRLILHKRLDLPRPDERFDEIVRQCENLARIKKVDEHSGEVKTRWVVRGGKKNDHWRHALTYLCLALEMAPLARRARRIITPYDATATSGRSWMSG